MATSLLQLCQRLALLVGLAVIGHGPADAAADQLVRFESAGVKPSALRQRLARQRGEVLNLVPGIPLEGYLTRPQGEGPFPAVVILHGCAGIFPSEKVAWPERLSSWGYVVLVVDSFRTRGIRDTCDRIVLDRVYDAYGALEFLSEQSFVDPDRIALMGFSAGGIATLQAVHLGAVEVLMERKFKAAIAYYPLCAAVSDDVAVPTLILIGQLDDWTPAEGCQKMMARRSGKGSVKLIVYEGAHHSFDAAEAWPGLKVYGHWIEFNPVAADRSIAAVAHVRAAGEGGDSEGVGRAVRAP